MNRDNMDQSSAYRIAVLISGGGTTLRNLIEKKSAGELAAEIALVISSKSDAAGLRFADEAGIPAKVFAYNRQQSIEEFSQAIFDACRAANVDLVVMGGFLKRVLVPSDFENRVVNIHPSLIPNFCGAGFYGIRVHRAAIEAGAEKSGCTVHFVDDEYDHGPIVEQAEVPVLPGDTPEELAKRVFVKECELYPQVINRLAAESENDRMGQG